LHGADGLLLEVERHAHDAAGELEELGGEGRLEPVDLRDPVADLDDGAHRARLDAGVELTSVVNVKGLRNRVTWKIESYNAPESLVLRGEGVGGTKVSLELAIRPEGEGSRVSFDVDFSGKLVVGPIGMTVKRALKGDVRSSIKKLTELID
jgi:hypothetical protein